MMRVPGDRPNVPPPISPKEAKEGKKVEEQPAQPNKAMPASQANIGRGPELDARAISVRLSALATEAKEKEISAESFEEILEEAITLTGLRDPQGAMEEANKKRQKEIEIELQRIKENKELMDEADSWEKFGELLSNMKAEQVEAFIGLMQNEIRAF